MEKFFFEHLLGKNYKTEGDQTVLAEFIKSFPNAKKLFYPSSGVDITDIVGINARRIHELKEIDPEVFIHSDFLIHHIEDEYCSTFTNMFFKKCYRERYKFFISEDKAIEVQKIQLHGTNNIKWLLFFGGFINEEIISLFVENKIIVPIIYSNCDGITRGMGGLEGSIPTLFYPLIAKELGIRFIITEQSALVLRAWNYNSFRLKNYVNNTLKIFEFPDLQRLTALPDEQFKKVLCRVLDQIHEYDINSDEKKRLFNHSFDWGNADDFVIKVMDHQIINKLNVMIDELRPNSYYTLIEEQSNTNENIDAPEIIENQIHINDENNLQDHENNNVIVDLGIQERASSIVNMLDEQKELIKYFERKFDFTPTLQQIENWRNLQYPNFKKFLYNSSLRTLLDRQISILEILQLDRFSFLQINGMGKSKWEIFKEFQVKLIEYEHRIKIEQSIENEKITLNFDHNKSLLQNMELFRDLIVKHVKEYHWKYRKPNENNQRKLDCFVSYFEEQPNLNYLQVAEAAGVTGERIRQLFNVPENRPYNIFKYIFTNPENYFLRLEGDFVVETKRIIEENLYQHYIEDILKIPSSDYNAVAKYIQFFGFDLAQYNDKEGTPDYVIINPAEYGIVDFKNCERELLQLMKKTPQSLTLYEISTRLSEKLQVQANVVEKLLQYYPYQTFEDDDGIIKYNIQPNLLGSLASKVERLLFRAGEPMTTTQITEELNRIQILYEDAPYEEDKVHIKRNENIKNLGNNLWIYADFWQQDDRPAAPKFIENLILKNDGIIEFEDVLHALQEHRYNIKENSARAYLLLVCKVAANNNNLFVHRDYLDQYPEIPFNADRNQVIGRAMLHAYKSVSLELEEFTKEEIQNAVYQKLSEENRDKRQIKSYFDKLVEKEYFIENNGIYLTNEDKDIATISYRSEPVYKTILRAQIVQDLKENPHGLALRELLNKYRESVPDNIRINNFYKFFQNRNLFEKFRVSGLEQVKLIPEYLPIPQPAHVVIAEPEDDVVQLRNEAFIPVRRDYNRDELYIVLRDKIARHFLSNENYDLAFNKFVNHVEGLNNGNFILQYFFRALACDTDTFDRMAYFSYTVSFCEPFLRSLGFIQTEGYDNGLGNLIKSSEELNTLRLYKRNVQHHNTQIIDERKLYFSKAIGSIWFYRNKNGHDIIGGHINENLDYIKLITQIAALYLYIITEVYEEVA